MAKETKEISFSGEGMFSPVGDMGSGKLADATAALAVLGYGSAEIGKALKSIDVENLSLEDIIRASLKQMIK